MKDASILVKALEEIKETAQHLPTPDTRKVSLIIGVVTEALKKYNNDVPSDSGEDVIKHKWESVFDDPKQYSSITVIDEKGYIFEGGYYQETGKVCISLPNDEIGCYDLQGHFRGWHYSTPPAL